MASKFVAAACHVSPITLSARKTTDKCISLINRAATNSAKLVVFPESYIPAFPVWSSMLSPGRNHHFFEMMAQESIFVDGEEMKEIREAAKQAGTVVSVGISEKARYSTATLFNSNIIIGADGEILVHHRKLMPTFFEKLTWSPGDGYGLRVANTRFAKIGALICGENENPLARYSLMAQGEQVHISTWPAVWPTQSGESKPRVHANHNNVAANRMRAAAHCFESKSFGIMCAAYLDAASIQVIASESADPKYVTHVLGHASQAATEFLDPSGAALVGYRIDTESGKKVETKLLQGTEDILYAEIDLQKGIEGKQYHDALGGDQRLDVFDLKVDRTRRKPATFFRSVETSSKEKFVATATAAAKGKGE
ncbi:nitrilase [Drepanopeziza brunnea f. sp. 'multigermtubi' MB_m1]|uniref:Nitrilase n=1 Tax=Marssonina brunnea f. sp. multigermtubi (strain MB_m1) TaxID=1072389 RepID=K1WIF5_MARBU|nr:nitrilase [Drepanopeziza brunnea f. sp. 'multigermtubi' MB_m1]EKD11982.1 nitrilase [Drepanopeziza brunnea f. sp. 'multigermtubi' MB_m1]